MSIERILRSTRFWILGGFLILAACLILSLWEPSNRTEHSICFFRHATEIPCPGCGLTRGFAALLKLDFFGALQIHPLSPLFAVEAFLLWIWWGLIAARNISIPSPVIVNRFLVLQAGLLLVVWGCRMTGGILPA
jgi:hypothetical protein